MNNLSLNIVNTPGYGKELKDNQKLLTQIQELLEEGVIVNILINGGFPNTAIYMDSHPNLNIAYSSNRLTLGEARLFLSKMTHTKWYMQIDEDDEFFEIKSWIKPLLKDLPEITTATAFYRILRKSTGEIYPNDFDNALYISGRKSEVSDFFNLCVSAGTLYNKEILGDFPRPRINFAEDNITFLYLCRHHPETTYIPLKIFIYNDLDSVMSKEGNDDGDPYSKGFDHMSMFCKLKCVDVK